MSLMEGITMSEFELIGPWKEWSRKGKKRSYGVKKMREAVSICAVNGEVRGFYSNLPLDPQIDCKDSMYPSVDHLESKDNSRFVVEARVINDMKSHLTKTEFWEVIEHLYSVGVTKGEIPNRKPLPLRADWRPKNQF
jgi:hypothetical protein